MIEKALSQRVVHLFRTFADELRCVIRLGLNVAKERLRFENSGARL
jgi:hypothetical protein